MIAKLLRLPLTLMPRQAVVPVMSGCNRGCRWVAGSQTHGCWIGWYELDLQRVLAALIGPAMTVWDLGANVGFYTLAFSRFVGPRGLVVAFEPSAINVGYLLKHIQLNRCKNVVVYQSAVTADSGFISFANHAGSGAMSHVSAAPTGYVVATVSIDHVLGVHPEWRPDVVKIDVEGAEGSVLAGGSTLLSSPVPPVLVLSLHGLSTSRECMQLLGAHGYAVISAGGGRLKTAEESAAEGTVIAIPASRLAECASRLGS